MKVTRGTASFPQARTQEPAGSKPKTHLRCCRCECAAAGDLYRRPSDPSAGQGYRSGRKKMCALHDVVVSGKVRYIGASSMWAWQFAELQFTATLNHWMRLISMQNFYDLAYREEEREMIPLCDKMGVRLIPSSPIARGFLARPCSQSNCSLRGGTNYMRKTAFTGMAGQREGDVDKEICKRVEKIAKDKGVSMANVAISWTLAKGCCLIVGLNKLEKISDTIAALKLRLFYEELNFSRGVVYSKGCIRSFDRLGISNLLIILRKPCAPLMPNLIQHFHHT